MRIRDPGILILVLVGFAAGYAGRWLAAVLPGYEDRPWWHRSAMRAAVWLASALAACGIIAWRLADDAGQPAGAWWAMWGIGVAIGVVLDEIHAMVDRLVP